MFKKILSFFYSMRLAIALLVVVALCCAAGSMIQQNQPQAYYVAQYGEGFARWIGALGLDDMFYAPWFLALCGLLLVNLLLCSVLRFPRLLRQYREDFSLEKRLEKGGATFAFAAARMPERFFQKMGFGRIDARGARGYAARRRLGLWGSWLCHLGMLVVAVGFAAGTALLLDTSVYGVPGSTLDIPGTGCRVTIDDFDIALRADDTVEQYTATLTVENQAGEKVSGLSQVNAPMSAFGLTLYQNSTGWATDVVCYEGDAQIQRATLCAGESMRLEALPLALVFQQLYPDYVNDGTGPRTKSASLDNPAVLFSLYYEGNLVDMNVAGLGYDINVDQYRFVFENPRHYTLIQVVRDPMAGLAAAGGLMCLIGIALAFYLRPEEVWFVREGERVLLYGRSVKGAALYFDKARRCLEEEGIEYECV